jgi:hypothetical protein
VLFLGFGAEVFDLSAETDLIAAAGRRPKGLLYPIKSDTPNPKLP